MKQWAFTFLLFLPLHLMAQPNKPVTVDVLQAFVDAFNAHDTRAIMALMTEDCVFQASAGPDEDGQRFTGREAVGKAFDEVFANFPDAQWTGPRHYVFGDRGLSEWVFRGTRRDGARVEVTGCDLFTFRDGKISVKNSYRKNRIPAR